MNKEIDNMNNSLILEKIELNNSDGYGLHPTFTDIEAWRNVFEEAQYDKNFKISYSSPNKLKCNEDSQTHFRKFLRNNDSEFDNRNSNYKFSRPGKIFKIDSLYEENLAHKRKEAIENLVKISNFLLKEFENEQIKKSFKNKLIDKINNIKKKYFIFLKKMCLKFFNVKFK